jgi:hypothetical protein
MRLDAASDIEAERNTLLDDVLAAVEADLNFAFKQIAEPTQEQKDAYNAAMIAIVNAYNKYGAVAKPTTAICQALREEVADIKKQCDEFIKSAKSS